MEALVDIKETRLAALVTRRLDLQLVMCKVSSPCHYETRLAASDVQGKQH
jgi:hypothetical protein